MAYHISEEDIYLFHQGTHYRSYQFMGCHEVTFENQTGFRFTVWAPHAREVGVAGDFNHWESNGHKLTRLTDQGLWSGFFTDVQPDTAYKYEITTAQGDRILKSDPYAYYSEVRPATASVAHRHNTYEWQDSNWQEMNRARNPHESPLNVYEVHAGSWKTHQDGSLYTYRELADELIPYVKSLGFTHIELLPLAEHPLDLSWGYQITGYYSVTSRYGTPDDFKYFVDQCHHHSLGVIMDWVPGHFCRDDHGLRQFDGEPLFEYSDPKKADKTTWGTLTFDFGRPEVQSFLISNAMFWLDEYHIDGIRADAVASMLYLNFDRPDGEEKIHNTYGGEDNLEAVAFIKKLNEIVFKHYPQTLMMAEDSSDLPLVTAPTYQGGLGFNFKWNMGWMNDTLDYMEHDPVYRKWHHNLLTFSFMYTHTENFVLPLSHDEVVHGKKSLLDKMPGDQWQQFAGLRLLYGYMMAHPGKKLLFMGGEFGQYAEWKDQEQLDWHLFDYPLHRSMHTYLSKLNYFYLENPALFEQDHHPSGFEWIDPHNIDQSVLAFMRRSKTPGDELIIVCNFTPEVSYNYKVGVPRPGKYVEVFNSDDSLFSGSGQLNTEEHFTIPEKWHGHEQHIRLKVPPLALTFFKRIDENPNEEEL
ncbi:1,4-alpha-glucan branching protein GlgB [Alteribacter natronophilus]|uniref:1,4-alpha-glucan branching protein GlgB n=1 Tax=Alteribacter natronophilus TaxID=2583810 RepID=UPI00110F09D8|nr:1,4-alpha-glucan branching protein GlgB [Alteribacter natronophilus]TMW71774.1 1,4-alpha-glucan branching protein GlgB [Alteribacter natronophilus]